MEKSRYLVIELPFIINRKLHTYSIYYTNRLQQSLSNSPSRLARTCKISTINNIPVEALITQKRLRDWIGCHIDDIMWDSRWLPQEFILCCNSPIDITIYAIDIFPEFLGMVIKDGSAMFQHGCHEYLVIFSLIIKEWSRFKWCKVKLTISEAGDGIFWLWGSIPHLLMHWPLKSPQHQQAWYWPPKPEFSISSIRRVRSCFVCKGGNIHELVQKRHNSTAYALELLYLTLHHNS